LDFITNLKKSCWTSKSHVERTDRFPIHKGINKIKWTTFLPCQYCNKLILTNNQNHLPFNKKNKMSNIQGCIKKHEIKSKGLGSYTCI
jgi:hypothetical protein